MKIIWVYPWIAILQNLQTLPRNTIQAQVKVPLALRLEVFIVELEV